MTITIVRLAPSAWAVFRGDEQVNLEFTTRSAADDYAATLCEPPRCRECGAFVSGADPHRPYCDVRCEARDLGIGEDGA